MKGIAKYGLIAAIAPVYWLLTISLRGGSPDGVSNSLVVMSFALLAATVIFSRSLMRAVRSR